MYLSRLGLQIRKVLGKFHLRCALLLVKFKYDLDVSCLRFKRREKYPS